MKYLIKNGANLNTMVNGKTLLIHACIKGNDKIVKNIYS